MFYPFRLVAWIRLQELGCDRAWIFLLASGDVVFGIFLVSRICYGYYLWLDEGFDHCRRNIRVVTLY